MSNLFPGQLAPYSQEAEEAVIGGVMVNPAMFPGVASFLKTEDFYILRHGYIWEALLNISLRDEQIDFVTLVDELRTIKHLEDIGGPGYLLHLVNATPDSTNAEIYGHLVERAALRRRLLTAADEIKALAMDEQLSIEKVGVEAWQRLENVNIMGSREFSLSGARSIEHYSRTSVELAGRFQRGELVNYPLPESWQRLREAVPALYLGHLVVVSGASGSGKSAMLESLSEHFARVGVPTDYVHTEMSTEEVLHRRMARHSGVSFHRLASGDLAPTPEGYAPADLMFDADQEIDQWVDHLAYHWMPDVKFERLQLHMKRAAMMGVKVFCIDHFQDIVPPMTKGGNEVRAFEAMCVWLKAFAELRRVLVIIASQLNDAGKVKWSRKLVEKADVWINIKRDRLKSDFSYLLDGVEYQAFIGEHSPRVDIQVNKARFGKLAKVTMLYHGPAFRWHDMSDIRTRPGTAGKVISLEEAQARHRAEGEA